MSKNIVICIDGTGDEFGACNSNVVKLYSVLRSDSDQQISFYHPGLGTMGSPHALSGLTQWWTKMIGLAFGYGLDAALTDCYQFLMETYSVGDNIYLFGFSRGAYTARALAAMVHMFGLVQRGNEPLIRYVLKMFQRKKRNDADFALAAQFKATFSRPCPIRFVGVWDTVSSIGWLYDPVTLPFTALNPEIQVGRQAVSIDERRSSFRQNLWKPDLEKFPQDIVQIWFAGVHSDVGGGYPEAESGLSKITLQWMLDEAEKQGLMVVQSKKDDLLGVTNAAMCKPNFMGKVHNSLTGAWWILEYFPRKHLDMSVNPAVWRWKIPRGAPRYIAPGAIIHPSVRQRIAADPTYRPVNLPRENPPAPLPQESAAASEPAVPLT